MSLRLNASEAELRHRFYTLQTPHDLASLLDISLNELNYYIHQLPPERQYTLTEIPKKSGGVRQITIPHPSIKIIQQKLNQVLKVVYVPSPPAHGFLVHRSIVSNAKPHVGRKWVLNIDLKDFFPSINFGRVFGVFQAQPYDRPRAVATVLAQICCFNNALPQGAPTSPIISNMICYGMDYALMHLAQSHKCFYTRYADDLTFSTGHVDFPAELAVLNLDDPNSPVQLGKELEQVISKNGFSVNEKKIRLHNERSRQEVTGIIVNEKLHVPRRYVRKVRAMLYSWEKYGLEKADWIFQTRAGEEQGYIGPYKTFPSFASVVRGRIEFIGMVHGKDTAVYRNLLNRYKHLMNPDYVEDTPQQIIEEPRIFISYAHKDREFVDTLVHSFQSAGINFWLDDEMLHPGVKWAREVNNALKTCKCMVLVISPNSMASENVEEEWQYFREERKPIIPVIKERTDIHFQLRRFQFIDFESEPYEQAFNKILEGLKKFGLMKRGT